MNKNVHQISTHEKKRNMNGEFTHRAYFAFFFRWPEVLNNYDLSGGSILRMMPGRSSGEFAMQDAVANSSGDAA